MLNKESIRTEQSLLSAQDVSDEFALIYKRINVHSSRDGIQRWIQAATRRKKMDNILKIMKDTESLLRKTHVI